MAKANVCDVCSDTIPSNAPRTILRVESAVGDKAIEKDAELDVCDNCRMVKNANALSEAITRIVVQLRAAPRRPDRRVED